MHEQARPDRYRQQTRLFFFANGLAMASWISRIPEVQQSLQLTDRALGLALLGLALGCLPANAVAARLTRRDGASQVGRGAALAMAAVLPLPALAPSGATLWLSLIVLGLCSGGLNVAQNTQAVAVERLSGRPMMISFHLLYSLGGLCGASCGAALVYAGLSPSLHLALVGAGLAVAMAASPRLPLPADDGTTAVEATSTAPLLILAVLSFCTVLCEGAMADWSGVYLVTCAGASTAVAALGFAAFALAMVLGRMVGDRLTARFGAERMLRGGGLLAAAGMAAALAWPQSVVVLAGFAAVGLGCSGTYPLLTRAGGSPSAIALVSSCGFVGYLVGPPLIGLTASFTGLRAALCILVVASASVCALARSATKGLP